jgi:hypothetical protein
LPRKKKKAAKKGKAAPKKAEETAKKGPDTPAVPDMLTTSPTNTVGPNWNADLSRLDDNV